LPGAGNPDRSVQGSFTGQVAFCGVPRAVSA
jgi:hypothetical protein